MQILEDFFEDILSKAQDGLKLTNRTLAEKSGLSLAEIKAMKNNQFTPDSVRKVAPLLGLDPEKLLVSANKSWVPETEVPDELQIFVSYFRDMSVNAYLLHRPGDNTALLIDTGVDPKPILESCLRRNCHIEGILLTHGHPDHTAVLPQLREAFPAAKCFGHPWENIANSEPVEWGQNWHIGNWHLLNVKTPGHTPGGTSYLVNNGSAPICFVGDSIFAGSVGGCASDYQNALNAIEKNVLEEMDDCTILCPGHGPLTTVGQEKKYNPFF